MKYKLLVLDLDGTLTNKQKKITPHTKETLLKIQELGVKIVLASGRPTYGIAPLAEQLELQKYEGYILAYNGGEIIDWKTKELMYKNLLDHDVLPYLYECAKKNDFAIVTYDGEYVLTEKPDDEYVLKEALLNVMKIKKVDNFLDAVKHPIAKCLIVGEPTRLAELEKEMYEHLKDRMGVFRSEPYFLELVPKGIDKAQSLAVLLKEIGLTREEMFAIGDGFNDGHILSQSPQSTHLSSSIVGKISPKNPSVTPMACLGQTFKHAKQPVHSGAAHKCFFIFSAFFHFKRFIVYHGGSLRESAFIHLAAFTQIHGFRIRDKQKVEECLHIDVIIIIVINMPHLTGNHIYMRQSGSLR